MKQSTLFGNNIETFEPGQEQIVETSFPYQTKKILFSMHYKHNLISFERLKTFLVEDRTLGCRHGIICNNFNHCYSCPPITQTLEQYNRSGYKNVLVYCFWVDWGFKINSENQYFRLINANRTLSPFAWNYGQKLETLLEGKDIIDGRCSLCIKCNYPNGCLYPDKRRSSLESLGVDASRLSKEVLQHEIQWYHKKNIPKYLTVIHALLTNSNEPKQMLK